MTQEEMCKNCPIFKDKIEDLELKLKLNDLHLRLINHSTLADPYESQEATELIGETIKFLERR